MVQLLSARRYFSLKRLLSAIGLVAMLRFLVKAPGTAWHRSFTWGLGSNGEDLAPSYNYRNAYDEISLWAQRAPLSIGPTSWATIWCVSLLLGTAVYIAAVLSAYSANQGSILSAKPTEVSFLVTSNADCTSSNNEPPNVGKWYGAAFGVSDAKVLQKLGAIICASPKTPDGLSSVAIVQALLQENQGCGNGCSLECPKYWRRRLARLLGGSLRSGADELARLPQPYGASTKSAEVQSPGSATVGLSETTRTQGSSGLSAAPAPDGCDIEDHFELSDMWGLLTKPTPISAPEVGKWLLGTQNCIGDEKDRCVLVTRLLQSALDNPDVRASRTSVNMIWGGERLAVILLFFVLLFCLICRSIVRQNLDIQKRAVLRRFAAVARTKQRRNARQASLVEPAATKEVYKWFSERFPQEQDNPDFTPIRNLLKVSEAGEIELRARIDCELIRESRVPLDTLITVFPVIGFVATLWGLITALSSANLIASSTGDARNASVMHVTSELSSCFSTTLLALVFMTAFAVWNTLQAKRELALVGDVQDCLLSGGNFSARKRQQP